MTATTTYKQTGIAWMPEVPRHWEVRRIKSFCDFINRGNTPNYVEKSDYKVVNQATFSKGFWDESKIRYSDFGEKNLKGAINKNDILLASTGGGVLGKVWYNKEELYNYVADSHVTILRDSLSRFYPKYFFYFLSINYDLINGILSEGSTNQTELQKDWLLNLKIALPPIKEQSDISNYLDIQSEKINHFIQKKQRFIELLKEQRQSIINEAVTKGGGKWISKRLKFIADLRFSNVDKHSIEDEISVRLCNYVDVYKNDYITNEMELMNATATESEIEKFKVLKGDIIITKDSEEANDIAVLTFVKEDLENVVCGYHLGLIRADETQVLSEYLFRAFQSKEINSYFEVRALGVTRVGLSLDDISSVRIAFPKSIEEQKKIITHIKTETATIDTAISKAEREIELIREYKEAMISEAVMGKRKTKL